MTVYRVYKCDQCKRETLAPNGWARHTVPTNLGTLEPTFCSGKCRALYVGENKPVLRSIEAKLDALREDARRPC